MTRPIVLLVLPRSLVLLDDVAFVLVKCIAAGDASLRHRTHAQSVHVQARRVLDQKRRFVFQPFEIRHRLRVHRIAVRRRVARAVDFRPRDVQKAQRIAGRECPGFVGADHVVRHGGDARSSVGRWTKRPEGRESRHTAFYRVPEDAGA